MFSSSISSLAEPVLARCRTDLMSQLSTAFAGFRRTKSIFVNRLALNWPNMPAPTCSTGRKNLQVPPAAWEHPLPRSQLMFAPRICDNFKEGFLDHPPLRRFPERYRTFRALSSLRVGGISPGQAKPRAHQGADVGSTWLIAKQCVHTLLLARACHGSRKVIRTILSGIGSVLGQ